jgi:hypothetical protein
MIYNDLTHGQINIEVLYGEDKEEFSPKDG